MWGVLLPFAVPQEEAEALIANMERGDPPPNQDLTQDRMLYNDAPIGCFNCEEVLHSREQLESSCPGDPEDGYYGTTHKDALRYKERESG